MIKIVISLAILIVMGCPMGNEIRDDSKLEGQDFQSESLYIVDLLRYCIENKGFNEKIRLEIDDFYGISYPKQNEKIKKEIASVYMAFLGKTDFKNIDSEKNDKLLKGLLQDLDEIEEAIEQL